MNNHNLVIYEFDELYKILVEIKKDINLSFEKATKQKLPDLNSKTNCLVFTKKEIPGLNNQIVFNDFPIPIFKLLEKINIEFIKKKFHEQSDITIGNYNFNLDNSIVFGLEREDDQMGFNKDATGRIDSSSHVTSQYFDYQSRITNNIYATFGARFDEHSFAGNEDSHRATIAYVFDNKLTKLKSSYGTGYRFPSLYELFFVWNSRNNCNFGGANCNSVGFKKAENSRSFDLGIEKSISSNLFIDLTYFNIEYEDALEGWVGNMGAGSGSTTQNSPSNTKSQGLELLTRFKLNEIFNFNLNYTYTQTYDGAEYDNPKNTYTGSQMVRVPRNIINLVTNIKMRVLL